MWCETRFFLESQRRWRRPVLHPRPAVVLHFFALSSSSVSDILLLIRSCSWQARHVVVIVSVCLLQFLAVFVCWTMLTQCVLQLRLEFVISSSESIAIPTRLSRTEKDCLWYLSLILLFQLMYSSIHRRANRGTVCERKVSYEDIKETPLRDMSSMNTLNNLGPKHWRHVPLLIFFAGNVYSRQVY